MELKRDLDQVIDYLDSVADDELITMHNQYCQNISSEDEVFTNDEEFFEMFFSADVVKAVRAISYGEYNYSDEYVKFNGYANLETTDSPGEWVDTTELAEYIMDNEHLFDEIEFIDEDEEE